jgi:hypothetical protein
LPRRVEITCQMYNPEPEALLKRPHPGNDSNSQH